MSNTYNEQRLENLKRQHKTAVADMRYLAESGASSAEFDRAEAEAKRLSNEIGQLQREAREDADNRSAMEASLSKLGGSAPKIEGSRNESREYTGELRRLEQRDLEHADIRLPNMREYRALVENTDSAG